MVARDIALALRTGARVVFQHISSGLSVDLIRAGKAMGAKIYCEVTPHHLFLSEDDIDSTYNTSLKVNPPLRTKADCEALIEGVKDGSIDAVVTDHAPHHANDKDVEYNLAAFGISGIETSFALINTHLVKTGQIDYAQMVELMAVAPREILGLEPVKIAEGSVADITVFDPDVEWVVDEAEFVSKSKNSGFIGAKLVGRATDVFVGGVATLKDGEIVE